MVETSTKKLVVGMMKNDSQLHFEAKKMRWIIVIFLTQTSHHSFSLENFSKNERSENFL
jgi:hypothetical protein